MIARTDDRAEVGIAYLRFPTASLFSTPISRQRKLHEADRQLLGAANNRTIEILPVAVDRLEACLAEPFQLIAEGRDSAVAPSAGHLQLHAHLGAISSSGRAAAPLPIAFLDGRQIQYLEPRSQRPPCCHEIVARGNPDAPRECVGYLYRRFRRDAEDSGERMAKYPARQGFCHADLATRCRFGDRAESRTQRDAPWDHRHRLGAVLSL
jgi:hypothetical protein